MDLALTHRGRDALRAAIVLAGAHHSGRLRTLRAVAEAMGVSRGTASHVLGDLVRSGLVVSTPGARGGYRLARPPEEVHLLAVVAAGEGSDCCAGGGGGAGAESHPAAAAGVESGAGSWTSTRLLQALWAEAGTRFGGPLRESTLAQLVASDAYCGLDAGPGSGPCGVLPAGRPDGWTSGNGRAPRTRARAAQAGDAGEEAVELQLHWVRPVPRPGGPDGGPDEGCPIEEADQQ